MSLLIPVKQAAAMLGISRSHLYAQIREGKLPTKKIGRRRLVSPAALERFADGREGCGCRSA